MNSLTVSIFKCSCFCAVSKVRFLSWGYVCFKIKTNCILLHYKRYAVFQLQLVVPANTVGGNGFRVKQPKHNKAEPNIIEE